MYDYDLHRSQHNIVKKLYSNKSVFFLKKVFFQKRSKGPVVTNFAEAASKMKTVESLLGGLPRANLLEWKRPEGTQSHCGRAGQSLSLLSSLSFSLQSLPLSTSNKIFVKSLTYQEEMIC